MGGGVDGSETESCGGVPSVWSTGSSPVGSSRSAVAVAGSVASASISEESVALCSRAVVAGGSGGAVVPGRSSAPVVGWYRILDSRVFPQEVWRRGEPDLRPALGRILIARTAGMAALEQAFHG